MLQQSPLYYCNGEITAGLRFKCQTRMVVDIILAANENYSGQSLEVFKLWLDRLNTHQPTKQPTQLVPPVFLPQLQNQSPPAESKPRHV